MKFSAEVVGMRWGYGLPLPQGAPMDPEAILGLLSGPDLAAATRSVPQMGELVPLLDALRVKKKPSKTDPALRQEVVDIETALADAMYDGIAATFTRAIDSPDGFRERLVQFWADHFTTTTRSQHFALFPLVQVEDAIRPNLTSRFSDLLRAAVLHPAMITYLDQSDSTGPNSVYGLRRGRGLNENLARELLELHTLGADAGYTQADVYQTAELLTGLSFSIRGGAATAGTFFDPARVEPGPEWVLGKKYDGAGMVPIHALLDDLATRPETAHHIARKLVIHFIADTPADEDVVAVEKAFNETGGDLISVYRALLGLQSAAQQTAQKARQPYDFMVASLRALGISGSDLIGMDRKSIRRGLIEPLAAMGHPFKSPRGPDGAPEQAEAWITPQGLAMRLNWALGLAPDQGRKIFATAPQDPVALAHRALGARARPELIDAVAAMTNPAEAIALVLISPAFNRR